MDLGIKEKYLFNQLNIECFHLRHRNLFVLLCYNRTYLRLSSIVPVKNGLVVLPLISLISAHYGNHYTHISAHNMANNCVTFHIHMTTEFGKVKRERSYEREKVKVK